MRANNTIYFAVRASKSRNNGTSPIQVQLPQTNRLHSVQARFDYGSCFLFALLVYFIAKALRRVAGGTKTPTGGELVGGRVIWVD